MNRKAIVTGATGFLGGWLVERLLTEGYQVVTILNPSKSVRENIDSKYNLKQLGSKCVELKANLKDREAIEAIVTHHKPDVFIHLAAVSDVTVSQNKPTETFEISANSTLNILESLRKYSPHTLFLSHTTDKVYSGNNPPFVETMLFKPSHIYEVAKVSQEHITSCFAQQYGLNTITLRCGNYFGGYDFNFNRIIPYAIKQCFFGDKIVFRSKGDFTRDFLYIEDAVLVNLMLIERHFNDNTNLPYGEAFNFSLELQLSVKEVVEKIAKLFGIRPKILVDDNTKSEIPDMRLSCQKTRRILNWQPTFNLEQGLKKTIESYSRYFEMQ